MSTITSRNALVNEGTSRYGLIAGGMIALSALLFVLGVASLFELVTLTDPIAGLPTVTVLGGLLVLIGFGVIGLGGASRLELIETTPDRSAGLVAGGVFGTLWFGIGGVVGTQLIGVGGHGWVVIALVFGVGAFVLTTLTREDIGSTVPAGVLAILTGAVFLAGVLGPGWSWSPGSFPSDNAVTFFPSVVVPGSVLICSLFAGWASAKAYAGFGARGRHLAAHVLIYLNALAIIAVLFGLVGFVVMKGAPTAFTGFTIGPGVGPETTLLGVSFSLPVSWPFLMNGASVFVRIDGILPAVVGTVWLVIGAVLFAVPLAVGAAVFLAEYAQEGRFTSVVEVATNGLWSTPSIVFGLFGASFLIPRFGGSKSLIAGMLTLGFMLLPLVLITSREAMLAVPDEYRDASAALGVSKWQTIRSVVLPAAVPGIVTGVILGVGRIAGETAPILVTMAGGTLPAGSETVDVIGGFEFIATPPFVTNEALLQASSALPYQLYALITAGLGGPQFEDAPFTALDFAWANAFVLLSVVLSFYAIGIATRYYFRRKLNR
jgi:phosphate transport system permease protein